jgi:hypothetical protein
MDKNKGSKKALRSMINDSMREAMRHLELPEPTKKAKKVIDRSSKKLASVFSEILKREEKKKKKTEKRMNGSLNGSGKKVTKPKSEKFQDNQPVKL